MKKTIKLFLFVFLILITKGYLFSQSPNNVIDFSFSHIISQDSTLTHKVDSLTKRVDNQFETLEEKIAELGETVDIIDNNTNDTYLTEAFKNYTFSLIYEILGYKSNNGSSTSLLSKIASIISFLFLLLRIYLFCYKEKDKSNRVKKSLNFYFIFLAFLLILLPWSALIFPNKTVDKTQIIRATERAKKLNDEIDKIESASFKELINDIQELQKMQFDTLRQTDFIRTHELDKNFDVIHNQLLITINKLDDISLRLNSNKDVRIATKGQQKFQTWLIVFCFIMTFIIFIFFIRAKPWKN